MPLTEFCIGLGKRVTLSVGMALLVGFLVYRVQDNVRIFSELVAAVRG